MDESENDSITNNRETNDEHIRMRCDPEKEDAHPFCTKWRKESATGGIWLARPKYPPHHPSG